MLAQENTIIIPVSVILDDNYLLQNTTVTSSAYFIDFLKSLKLGGGDRTYVTRNDRKTIVFMTNDISIIIKKAVKKS